MTQHTRRAALLSVALFFFGAIFFASAQELVTPITTTLAGDARDLAVPCPDGVFIFGDTFLNFWTTRLPNSMAWRVDGWELEGVPVALWQPDADAAASVPADCDGNRIAYMDATDLDGHDFLITSSGIVTYGSGTWTKHRLWDGHTIVGNVAFANGSHMLTSEGGRTGPAYLARTGDWLNAGSYEWWTGQGWTTDMSAAQPVIPGRVGEMDICRRGERYVVAYMTPDIGAGAIVVRSSADLVTWSEPVVLIDWNAPGLHGTYAPKFPDGCALNVVEMLVSHNEPTAEGFPRGHVYLWRIPGSFFD